MRLAPSSVLGERMPRSWKLFDSFKGRERFDQKPITKASRFGVLILDRLVKLLLSDIEKANLHLFICGILPGLLRAKLISDSPRCTP